MRAMDTDGDYKFNCFNNDAIHHLIKIKKGKKAND